MTIVQSPFRTKFSGDMTDLIISSEDSITFEMKVDGSRIIHEQYSPDGNMQIRVSGIADALLACIYGSIDSEQQAHAAATVELLVDDVQISSQTVYCSRMRNVTDMGGANTILTHGRKDSCMPGTPHVLTMISTCTVRLKDTNGSTLGSSTAGTSAMVKAVDCDPAVLFPGQWRDGHLMDFGNGQHITYIDRHNSPGLTFRFLNMYDMPESVTALPSAAVKPGIKANDDMMYGITRRFDIQTADTYECRSPRLCSYDEALKWRDLMAARRAQVHFYGEWVDIVVERPNFQTGLLRTDVGGHAKFTFTLADKHLQI